MTSALGFLGRFHPVVLHLPIGLLAAAFVLTLAARTKRFAHAGAGARLVLSLGAASAVVAASLGLLLGMEGGYDETLLGLHRWSGVGLAAGSLALVWMAGRPAAARAYVPLFTACMVLMLWVGHLGGTLTHGPGYLVEHAPAPVKRLLGAEANTGGAAVVVEDIERAAVVADLIMPVLDATCTECHNPIKRKGELDLTTPDGLFTGGEHPPVASADGALDSELFRRLILPPGHDDAMPPAGRARLAPEDVELIGWWLDEGASRDATVGALSPDRRRLRMLRERFGRRNPLDLLAISPAGDRAIARAGRGPFLVERIAEDRPYLRARLRPGGFGDEPLSLGVLAPVREQIVELDVGDSSFDDEAAEALPSFRHLRRLAVHNTAITDEALRLASALDYLEHLNVYGTRVTDRGMQHLRDLAHLRRVYAWHTGVTVRGWPAAIDGQRPVSVDLGVDSAAFASTALPPPAISVDSALFVTQATVSLGRTIPGADLHYTTDGSAPTTAAPRYAEPFTVDHSAVVRAIAAKDGWVTSPTSEAHVLRRGLVPVSARLGTPPSPDYPGEGGATLTDGRLGTATFRSPQWLGYRETDLQVVLDLGEPRRVDGVTVSFLENTGSWIFPPARVDVALSADGSTFRRVASMAGDQPTASRTPSRSMLPVPFDADDARWIRVRVRRVDPLPGWHPGKGEPAWVFVDEILVGGAGAR